MLFARGYKTVKRQRIFAHVRVNQQCDFRVQFAKRGVSRKRNLYEVANTTHINKHLVRSFFGEAPAQLPNHGTSVLPPFLRLSTRTANAVSPPVAAHQFRLAEDV